MRAIVAVLASVLSVASLGPGTASAATGATTRVSVDSTGAEATDYSVSPAVSADGRYVAFRSDASNLVAGDTNGAADIFVHDRQTGTTSRVSVGAGGEANNTSFRSAISGDGRYVAFESNASNLVAGDTKGHRDIFVHDRQTGATSRVSVGAGGDSDASSSSPTISADGRYVAFTSSASNLVAGDTNGGADAFVHDRQTGAMSRVSVGVGGEANTGGRSPAISADGRYVAFTSSASNLVAGDTNGGADIFVHDREMGATSRVNVSSNGAEANGVSGVPAISADGRYVSFYSYAFNLVVGDTNGRADVFVHDRQTGATSRVSVGSTGVQSNHESFSSHSGISADGRYVTFRSASANLVVGDRNGFPDIFMHDRRTGATSRVNVGSAGAEANHYTYRPVLSTDGQVVAFDSFASNLVAGDTNDDYDVFVHALLPDAAPPTDTTPPAAPTVALTDPVNAASQAVATVSGTGEGGTTADISVDDEDPATAAVTTTAPVSEFGYSSTLDLSALSDGTLSATVTLTDAAGNTGPAGTAIATKDTVAPAAPTVVLTDRVHPANQAAATVSGTGEGGATGNISVDDKDPATAAVTAIVAVSASGYSAALDLSSLSIGTLVATVTLTDAAGNTGASGNDTATKVGPPLDRGPAQGRP